ncbi:protein GOS9-like [Typha latifolia]|uniref:protein GOS9-like n=1 Tax=Typha latifolia TaxID=4733 RepID=UPI003C3051EE
MHPSVPLRKQQRVSEDMAGVIKVGKWGGDGGEPFDMGAATRLLAVRVRHGAAIDAIQILYERDGYVEWTPQFGGDGGELDEITLQEGEFLTSISGYYGDFASINVVRSLTFGTNLSSTYGPYGVEEGTPFSAPLEEGQIVGFFGRSGALLDAIGVYLGPN